MKRALLLPATLGLAGLCPAFDLRHQVFTYPSASYVLGNPTQALIGQLSDDVQADVALLQGGEVHLLYAPDRICGDVKTTTSGGFTSMAKVRLSGSPAQEGLLASTSSGLALLQWSATSRSLVATNLPDSASWANARKLQALAFGTGPSMRLCALSSNSSTVLFADWNGTQIPDANNGSFGLGAPALDMVGLDWAGDTLLEFAVDDGTKLSIFSHSGTSLYTFGLACPNPQLLRLAKPGSTDDLVWLTANPFGPGQALTVVHSNGAPLDPAWFSGPAVIASMTLADIDADGAADLVVTRSDAHLAHVLYHQSSGPNTFGFVGGGGGANGMTIDTSTASGTCALAPVVAGGDIDGDGDGELFFAGSPACGSVPEIVFGDGVDDEYYPRLPSDPQSWVKAWLQAGTWSDWPSGTNGPATLTVAPWGLPTAGPLAGLPLDLRVTIWGRAKSTSAVDPVCLVDSIIPMPTPSSNIQIPRPASLPQYLVVEVGYVRRDASGTHVLASYPSWTGQFDHALGLVYSSGTTTTGGINRPPPPPTGTGGNTIP